MIQPEHKLPIVGQCKIVALAPSTFYYKAEPVSEADLKVMFRIDQLHREMPFAGARMGDQMSVTEKAGSMFNQAKDTVQAKLDETKQDIRKNT